MIMLFGLLLDNWYLTLFLWWTVFLYLYFKGTIGWGYVNGILFGSVLYLLSKISFRKEHIGTFLNCVLWLGVVNLFYGIAQVCGYDFIFEGAEHLLRPKPDSLVIQAPCGFMGNTGIAAFFYAILVPIMASRQFKYASVFSLVFFIPIFFLHSSSAFVSAIIGLLFVMYYKIRRLAWIALIVSLCIAGGVFITKFDPIGSERFSQWHAVMKDYAIHPVTGWGPDSFRHYAPHKPFIYAYRGEKIGNTMTANAWDNPHNLYISILYEFGIVGMILFVLYLRKLTLRFKDVIKEPNTLALSGILLVFLIFSIGGFPIFVARCAVIIVPTFALLEVQMRGDYG